MKSCKMTSCKTQTNQVTLSSIVPRSNKLKEKATRLNERPREECEARSLCSIDHKNNYNKSGLHLNYSRTKKLVENVLVCLCKSD